MKTSLLTIRSNIENSISRYSSSISAQYFDDGKMCCWMIPTVLTISAGIFCNYFPASFQFPLFKLLRYQRWWHRAAAVRRFLPARCPWPFPLDRVPSEESKASAESRKSRIERRLLSVGKSDSPATPSTLLAVPSVSPQIEESCVGLPSWPEIE